MDSVRVTGVDPGLVDTGVVDLEFYPINRTVTRAFTVLKGIDVTGFEKWLDHGRSGHVFIEAYRPRSAFDTDARMVQGVSQLRQAAQQARALKVDVVNNTGVKKVVRKELLKDLKLWKFPQSTHHQDLRSAGYIALYGMLKDPSLNQLLSDFVSDLLQGNPWKVES